MVITNDMTIILTLACFIIGLVMGIRLIRPQYRSGSRGYSSHRYDD